MNGNCNQESSSSESLKTHMSCKLVSLCNCLRPVNSSI